MGNIPMLRFPEFSGPLKQYCIKEIMKLELHPIEKPKTDYWRLGIRSHAKGSFHELVSPDNIGVDTLYIVKKNMFIINITFAWEHAFAISNEKDEGKLVSHRFPTYVFLDNMYYNYFKYYFSRLRFKYDLGVASPGGAGRNRVLNKSNFLEILVTVPGFDEQRKIASFFSLIDKKIELQTEKVEELKKYKKGIMQKIFSQELRFKDENGNEYPEWEEKTLQQIGFTYAGLSGKTKEDFGFGNGSFVTYINVFRNTLAKRMIEQVNISEQENQNPVLKGDLLFTTSSETPNEVGMVSCWDYEIKNLYLNSFCFGYRIYNHNSYSPIFLAYMLRSGEYRKKISILAQGSTRYNISKTELMKMKVQCPCMEEQQKIVALLLNLELKTEEEQNKLNELLQYKKGLLQQMFI